MEGIGRYIALAIFLAFVIIGGYSQYKENKEEFRMVSLALIGAILFMALMAFIGNYW